MEATILEVMRRKTMAPFSVLHQTLNDTEVGGYFVSRGTMVKVPFTRHTEYGKVAVACLCLGIYLHGGVTDQREILHDDTYRSRTLLLPFWGRHP